MNIIWQLDGLENNCSNGESQFSFSAASLFWFSSVQCESRYKDVIHNGFIYNQKCIVGYNGSGIFRRKRKDVIVYERF